MPEESKQVEVQVVDNLPLDERLIKAFEKIAEKTYLQIQKRDYRATMVARTEKAELPDSEAALIHINEDDRDQLDNPVELDYKGDITPYEAFMFKDVNYAMALAQLKDWAFFDEPELDPMGNPKFDEHGNMKIQRIPVNLAQIDMLSKKRLNLGVGGKQGWKHIAERRANAGMPPDENSTMNKVYGWAGFRKERVSNEELEAQYGGSAKKQ
jgi:hypothetical protein